MREPPLGPSRVRARCVHLVEVPVSEEWYFNIQVRIVTLNLFIRWENLTGKSDNIDFPNRTQARIRTIYGIRWILNN